jgi:hypothetical protein
MVAIDLGIRMIAIEGLGIVMGPSGAWQRPRMRMLATNTDAVRTVIEGLWEVTTIATPTAMMRKPTKAWIEVVMTEVAEAAEAA